jgi:hypothetical protein
MRAAAAVLFLQLGLLVELVAQEAAVLVTVEVAGRQEMGQQIRAAAVVVAWAPHPQAAEPAALAS